MPGSSTSRVPSYRLHKPSGLAVVRLNDSDFYLGKHDTRNSREAYERLIAERLSNHRQLPGTPEPAAGQSGTELTINELRVAYWHHAETHYVKRGQPTGELANRRDAMRPVRRPRKRGHRSGTPGH